VVPDDVVVAPPRLDGAANLRAHAVGLHPLGAMFALLAGFQLAGLLGGLFAVPLAGALWLLLGAAYRNVVLETPASLPALSRPSFRNLPQVCACRLIPSGDALALTAANAWIYNL
jgi:hypothetical protein